MLISMTQFDSWRCSTRYCNNFQLRDDLQKPFPKFEKKFLLEKQFSPAEIYNIAFQEPDMEHAIERLKNQEAEAQSLRQTWG